MQPELVKSYEPEFTQLPFGFLSLPKNIGLRKLIRTSGVEYLSYFIIIQDAMAGYSDKDFTLSIEELKDALRENLYMYDKSEKDIEMYIKNLFDHDVLIKRKIYNLCTQQEEERYCIESVADLLESTREAWCSKCINPLKLSTEEKNRIKSCREKINECRREVRQLNERIDYLDSLIEKQLKEKHINGQEVGLLREEIKIYEEEKKELYKQIHVNQDMINKIKIGGILYD